MSTIKFDINVIREKLLNTNIKLPIYWNIMKSVHNTNVSTDTRFQHDYKSFYGMHRYTDATFCKAYFEYLEENKNNKSLSFENVITHLYHCTDTVQPSFSSKLLHTINQDMPILDSRIIYHLKLKTLPYYFPKVLYYYNDLCNLLTEYLKTENASQVITVFDDIFGETGLSDMKKIDNAIWVLGAKPKRK